MNSATTANEELAKYLKERLGKLQADRTNFNSTWERIARVVLPAAAGFTTTTSQGSNNSQEIFESTAMLALPRYAAAIDTLVTPQTNRWHTLKPQKKELKNSEAVQKFNAWLTDLLFSVRYAPKSGFASQAFAVYMSQGAFGNGVMYVQDAKPGIRYIAVHLSEIWLDENCNGIIDTAYWCHEYTQRQAVQKWGDKLPSVILEDEKKNPDKKLKFCKAVYPRTDRDPAQKNAKNMPFASTVFLCDKETVVVEESGYRVFPFAVARDMTSPKELYARGAAERCLADTLTLQEMTKTSLRYGQLTTEGVYMASSADNLEPFSTRPGAVNYGYLSPDGQEQVKPLRPAGDPGFSLELANQRRQAINGSFLVNLFQVLVESGSDRMTATEVMQRVQEKGALLGPIGGRLRTEFLGPMIERELDILFHAGVVTAEDVPEELRVDGGIDVEYDSPLTRAMRAEAGVGILRTLEFVSQVASQVAAADQARAAKIIRSVNYERGIQHLADINGAPPDLMFSEEELAASEQREQEQVQSQQLLQAAPAIAATAKTLAETQQLTQNQTAVI